LTSSKGRRAPRHRTERPRSGCGRSARSSARSDRPRERSEGLDAAGCACGRFRPRVNKPENDDPSIAEPIRLHGPPVRGRTAGVSASGGLSYYAAPFRLAAGVFSAPGADTRLRAGNVPGERAPADEAAIRARQHQAMLRAADATDEGDRQKAGQRGPKGRIT
jgi:hypothetical protein